MNIFIASLPYQMEETEIKEIFEDYGRVNSVKLITDKETGRSKGYGFIDMPNDDEALKAIEILNGTEIYHRNISVSKAQERKEFNRKPGFSKRREGYSSGNGFQKNYYNRDNRQDKNF